MAEVVPAEESSVLPSNGEATDVLPAADSASPQPCEDEAAVAARGAHEHAHEEGAVLAAETPATAGRSTEEVAPSDAVESASGAIETPGREPTQPAGGPPESAETGSGAQAAAGTEDGSSAQAAASAEDGSSVQAAASAEDGSSAQPEIAEVVSSAPIGAEMAVAAVEEGKEGTEEGGGNRSTAAAQGKVVGGDKEAGRAQGRVAGVM